MVTSSTMWGAQSFVARVGMIEWRELLSDARNVVSELLVEPVLPVDELVRQTLEYQTWVCRMAGPLTDLPQAERLARATVQLLGHVMHRSTEEQRLAQVAARYFVRRGDGEDDLLSPFGFDDDVEVFNSVASRLGLGDRRLRIVDEL